jgi:hypothetical protein
MNEIMNTMNDMTKAEQHERDIASSVLARIDKEAIAPTPRWHFLLHDGVVWSLGGVAVVLGALSVAAIIFTGRYSDWEYYEATHENLTTFAFEVMPYTWIFALALFGGVAYLSIRHTKRGYRYPLPMLLLGAVGASTVLGAGLYGVGAGPLVDEELGRAIPLHRSLKETKIGFWNQPERGVIAGVVDEIGTDGQTVTLRTLRGTETISISGLDSTTREAIEVGSALRVLAPREVAVPPPPRPVAAGESADAAFSMTAPMTAEPLRAKSTERIDLEMSDDHGGDTDRALREACLIIPLDWERGFRPRDDDGEKEDGHGKRNDDDDLRRKCLDELRNERKERLKEWRAE